MSRPTPFFVLRSLTVPALSLIALTQATPTAAQLASDAPTTLPAAPAPTPTTQLHAVSPHDTELFTPHLTAGLTRNAPTIDGDLSDNLWSSIPERRFLNSVSGSAPDAATSFRAAYDDSHLYLAFRAFEKGQETQRHQPALRDSSAIFTADCVEIFLQPRGHGTPNYQVVANIRGALWDHRYDETGKPVPWDGNGIRTSGAEQADTWTLEVAIPFADLGASPAPGRAWRFNACRTEKPSGEYTCWSPTRGGYHLTERFGYLEFGARPEDAATVTGTARALGMVLEEDGQPVINVAVRTAPGTARTDSLGRFTLTGLPRGDIALRIDSPRYETYAARFAVDQPEETLPTIQLVRRDPYRPAYELPPTGATVTWLTSSLEEPPDMEHPPGASDSAGNLDLLAAPGEYESVAVALYAHQPLDSPAAVLTDLRGPDGSVLRGAAQVRWTQRLLKRIQYTRDPEDAVFTWRYLWRESPEQVRAGQVRQLVVTIHVPDSAAPGMYRGDLVLTSTGSATGGSGGSTIATLPVTLQVTPFTLAEPDKRVGAYYRGHRLSDDQVRLELADIHAHGGRVLVWHAGIWYGRGEDGQIQYNTEAVERAVRLQQEFGIGPPYLVGTNPRRASALAGLEVEMTPEYAAALDTSQEFRRIYGEGIRRLHALEQELGAGEFLFTWMDEVFGRGRFEPWQAMARITRQLSDHRIYITLHNRNQTLVDRADPHVDVRGYHGHTLDWWLGQGHTFDQLKAELDTAGDEAWTYYNIRGTEVTAEWVRLCNGYWLWRSPVRAHTPWIYYAYGGSPFDDLDSPRHDFAYAAPHPDKAEMVSSLEWEAFREGWDDLRYLVTLERAIDRASEVAPGDERVTKARGMLRAWWDSDPRVPVQAEVLGAGDYQARKRAMAQAIQELQALTR